MATTTTKATKATKATTTKATTKATKAPAVKTTKAPALVGHPDTSLIAYILAETEKRIQARPSFFTSAADHHKKEGTVFPRDKVTAARLALTKDKVDAYFAKFDKRVNHPSMMDSKACYDVYMMNKA